MSSSAANQQFDIRVLGTIATPVFLGVLLYLGYALTFWRPSRATRPTARRSTATPRSS
jgi:hypothetical protein